ILTSVPGSFQYVVSLGSPFSGPSSQLIANDFASAFVGVSKQRNSPLTNSNFETPSTIQVKCMGSSKNTTPRPNVAKLSNTKWTVPNNKTKPDSSPKPVHVPPRFVPQPFKCRWKAPNRVLPDCSASVVTSLQTVSSVVFKIVKCVFLTLVPLNLNFSASTLPLVK